MARIKHTSAILKGGPRGAQKQLKLIKKLNVRMNVSAQTLQQKNIQQINKPCFSVLCRKRMNVSAQILQQKINHASLFCAGKVWSQEDDGHQEEEVFWRVGASRRRGGKEEAQMEIRDCGQARDPKDD